MTAPNHTVIMTGASRGLGRRAAACLLRDYPDLHLLLTVRGRASDAGRLAAGLAVETGNANVSALPCDLSSFADVRTAAGEARRRLAGGDLPPLIGFVGNAGIQMTSATRATVDGFETTFAVNVLAPCLLVRLLLDSFAPFGRVVLVGSDVHFGDARHNLGMVPAPCWQPSDQLAEPGTGPAADTVRAGRRAYATSKLGVIYLVHALARRLPPGIDVYSYNPGLVPGTGLTRDAGPATRLAARTVLHAARATPFATGPERAGRLLARAAAGPRPGGTGAYLDRGRPTRSSPESYDEGREEELWATAARLCGLPAEVADTGRRAC
ncbi:SDR family NAD(P)-dependent oxidoreductase [Streptomyces sp. B1866]|uniref:SDR family NAD(P)-dependent oxidoreductase n=1 Tax=Streptomyces sp. B1866 TaxID=3075431 RepID=UPI00288E1D5C|nr:SDR family NAD(P)-dependent oxidoreductase [Streptomyces sp. B1866]MDT3396588.1 SDR family NAD(P)-dependent oxidoreductase [Streptomyces sp. B1866]